MIAFRNELWFCSNFYPCQVEFENITYPSSEHAFQAAKTLDLKIRKQIRDLEKAGDTKKMGHTIKLREDWEEVKVDVMKKILINKFKKDSELWLKLKATGTKTLVEYNEWHDNFFGSCTCVKCGNKGKNVLGMLLMDIRDRSETKI